MRGVKGHDMMEPKKRDPLEGEIRHSYGCVKETDMQKLKRNPKVKRMIESELGKEMRKFAVHDLLRLDKERLYTQKILVDVVTGSMYDFMSGQCLSSTRIRIVD
jgi:hypothetical protein